MKNEIWYTARETFDSDYKVDSSWNKYIEWSKLTHLSELVSLDGILNGLILKSDFDSINPIIEKTMGLEYFNLLAVIKEPNEEKSKLNSEFEFIGYDLIETEGNVSALTNCGGFDESFLPKDLNGFGLVTEWTRAKKIQTDLRINNPEEQHADCYLFEVWRHKRIGRKELKTYNTV